MLRRANWTTCAGASVLRSWVVNLWRWARGIFMGEICTVCIHPTHSFDDGENCVSPEFLSVGRGGSAAAAADVISVQGHDSYQYQNLNVYIGVVVVVGLES